jgi:hypothetical protein
MGLASTLEEGLSPMTTKHEAILEENAKLRAALANLRDAMRAHDDKLNDDDQPCGAQSPTGDDYNDLFCLVLDALRDAGMSLTAGSTAQA